MNKNAFSGWKGMALPADRRAAGGLFAGACGNTGNAGARAGDETQPAVPTTATGDATTWWWAGAASPITLDPADHRDRTAETVIRNMFDGLVTRDTRSGVHLELAESIEWVDDVTMDVVLRQGVLFHDGTEMTADDVVFTFERIILDGQIEYPEVHSSPRKGLISPLESVERLDDYSVRFHFNAPWPPAMQLLVHQRLCQSYIERVGTQGFVEHPIGTGSFKFVSA